MGKLTVSVRQFERWSAGTVKSQPRPDTCRVLEAMFGYPVHVLLAPPDQVGRARSRDKSSGEARAPFGQPGFGDDLAAEIAHESQEFGDWVAMSEVADETISQYQAQVRRLARDFE